MKLIINADDFGLSHEVNREIIGLTDDRRITSATILANGPEVEAAVCAAIKRPWCSYGVHLNITAFRPFTDNRLLQPLLNEDGAFSGDLSHVQFSGPLLEAIYMELEAQVSFLLSKGVRISHFDSHHHIHTLPELFFVLKKLQKRFSIHKVRTTKNIYNSKQLASFVLRLKKGVWNFGLRRYYRTRTTDYFCEFAILFDQSAQPAPSGSLEAMVHPGAEQNRAETEVLRTAWQSQLLYPVQLVSYHDI